MVSPVVFSSSKDDWEVPDKFYQGIKRWVWKIEGRAFTIDLAASPRNAKEPRFYTKEDNSLAQNWTGEAGWLNPPYTRNQIGAWFNKAIGYHGDGKTTTTFLVPSRTDVTWFHEDAMKADYLIFVRGRLRFKEESNGGKPAAGAPFPSVVIHYSTITRELPPVILTADRNGTVFDTYGDPV